MYLIAGLSGSFPSRRTGLGRSTDHLEVEYQRLDPIHPLLEHRLLILSYRCFAAEHFAVAVGANKYDMPRDCSPELDDWE